MPGLALLALLSTIFGLILTWHDNNIGEGLNFILAGLVLSFIARQDIFDFTRRR